MEQQRNQPLEAAHRQVWSRFIHQPHGIVLDYANSAGFAPIPTPEECERSVPNALGWWTPIENGGFFTGLYLAGLMDAWKLAPHPGLESEIRTLIRGLFLLQDVSDTPGFIARGVAQDGSSHYALGSDDQTGPWLYGLWKAWRYGFGDAALRDELKARMLRVLDALHALGWHMPTEWSGQTRGEWIGDGFREAARLLFACKLGYALSGEEKWRARYLDFLHSKPEGCLRTRAMICEDGFAMHMVEVPRLNGQFWIYLGAQAALRALADLEEDALLRRAYEHGLYVNGMAVEPFLNGYRDYRNEDETPFDTNWRRIAHLWKEQRTVEEAVQLSGPQAALWMEQVVPRKRMENAAIRQVLYAQWIAHLSGFAPLQKRAIQATETMLQTVRWETLYLPDAFVAECVYWAGQMEAR